MQQMFSSDFKKHVKVI